MSIKTFLNAYINLNDFFKPFYDLLSKVLNAVNAVNGQS